MHHAAAARDHLSRVHVSGRDDVTDVINSILNTSCPSHDIDIRRLSFYSVRMFKKAINLEAGVQVPEPLT